VANTTRLKRTSYNLMKRYKIIPWIECNTAPDSWYIRTPLHKNINAKDSFHAGAYWWSQITDTMVYLVEQADAPTLARIVGPGGWIPSGVIPGAPNITNFIAGMKWDRLYEFTTGKAEVIDEPAAYTALGAELEALASALGTTYVMFDTETGLAEFRSGNRSYDPSLFEQGLDNLPKSLRYIIYAGYTETDHARAIATSFHDVLDCDFISLYAQYPTDLGYQMRKLQQLLQICEPLQAKTLMFSYRAWFLFDPVDYDSALQMPLHAGVKPCDSDSIFVFTGFKSWEIAAQNMTQQHQTFFPETPLGEVVSGMGVNVVKHLASGIDVETTGATYKLIPTGIEMWRNIDASTNNHAPKIVAEILFGDQEYAAAITNPRIVSKTRAETVVESTELRIRFFADSLIMIENLTDDDFTYLHANLLEYPEWMKTATESDVGGDGSIGAKIWGEYSGGSLLAPVASKGTITHLDDNVAQIVLPSGGKCGHSVFPCKFFDFNALYSPKALPGLTIVSSEWSANWLLSHQTGYQDDLCAGTVLIYNFAYTTSGGDPEDRWGVPPEGTSPTTLTEGPWTGYIGYELRDPTYYKQLVADLHAQGYKVLFYFQGIHPNWNYQDMEVTLGWMAWFKSEFNNDGWYFDNADYSGYHGTVGGEYWPNQWYECYKFVKRVREVVGNEGYVLHHHSVDVLGRYSWVRAVNVDAYMNATWVGETELEIHSADDLQMRYYVSGYGMSQAIGGWYRFTGGWEAFNGSSLSYAESYRLSPQIHMFPPLIEMRPDYGDMELYNEFVDCFKPGYLSNTTAFQNGTLDPDPVWPVREWWQPATQVVATPSYNSITLTWATPTLSNSEVYLATIDAGDDFTFFKNCYSDDKNKHLTIDESTVFHSVTVDSSTPDIMLEIESGADYYYAIRSHDVTNDIIYHAYGSVTTLGNP
jgi:hypothetical protein